MLGVKKKNKPLTPPPIIFQCKVGRLGRTDYWSCRRHHRGWVVVVVVVVADQSRYKGLGGFMTQSRGTAETIKIACFRSFSVAAPHRRARPASQSLPIRKKTDLLCPPGPPSQLPCRVIKSRPFPGRRALSSLSLLLVYSLFLLLPRLLPSLLVKGTCFLRGITSIE